MLCVIVGQIFRLRQVAMQAVNYLIFPLQIILMPVFVKIGDSLFGAKTVSLNPLMLRSEFSAMGPQMFFEKFGLAGIHAISAWALILPVPTMLLAHVLRPIFTRISERVRY